MKQWFNCKARYQKQDDEGKISRVTESYLIDATNYIEAETRFHEEMEKLIDGTFDVASVTKTNITEVMNFEDSEEWYKVKVQYVSIDEESEKAKTITSYFLVTAESVKETFERVEDNLNHMIVPFELPAISLTSIVDVFPYVAKDETVKANEELIEH